MFCFFTMLVASMVIFPAHVTGNVKRNISKIKSLQQQHYRLQQNQAKMMQSLRALVKSSNRGIFNATIDNLKQQLETLSKSYAVSELKIQNLETSVHRIKKRPSYGSGAVFTRWGREDCPSRSSRLIYFGSVGGQSYATYGGGASYLCLHRDPELLQSLSGSYSSLYGGEYDTPNFGNSRLHNGDDIPCAVCQSTRGVQKLMIPGRVNCLKRWTKQYAGYLATSYHKASAQYICMDENPKASHKGHQDYNGALIIPVKAACGALPCPPYKNGNTITCVVCTK